ncbi:unnamed protein product, partial [Choristocarpus tenellus]
SGEVAGETVHQDLRQLTALPEVRSSPPRSAADFAALMTHSTEFMDQASGRGGQVPQTTASVGSTSSGADRFRSVRFAMGIMPAVDSFFEQG